MAHSATRAPAAPPAAPPIPPTVAAAAALLPFLLPPSPTQLPRGFTPQVFPSTSRASPADRDLVSPSGPPFRAASASDDEVVPETPPELLRRPANLAPAGQAAERLNAAGGWCGMSHDITAQAGAAASTSTHPSWPWRSGLEEERQARHGRGQGRPSLPPCRVALPSTRGAFTAGQRPHPPPPPAWLLGRCFHYVYKVRRGHRASECRDPVKCRRCFRSGHRARFCEHPQEPTPSPDTVSPAPSRRPPAVRGAASQGQARPAAPPLLLVQGRAAPGEMPRLDDVRRSTEDYVVIHGTAGMNEEAARLLSNAAYAWFERPPAREARAMMQRAIASKCLPLRDDVCVTDHFPERYLVRFIYPHHRAAAVGYHDFIFEGLTVQERPWRLEDNAEQVNFCQHVRLCIKNLPLYAWNETEAQQAIGRACSLDYIE
ncbi:hypothetical protein ACQ4PT_062006 [Festuca glaucescens]